MRAVVVIVRTGRNQFDGVGAKDGKFANILFPHRDRPRVIGIGFWTIAKLMPANCHVWRRGLFYAGWQIEPLPFHCQLAQQIARSKHHATVVIAGDNRDWRRGPICRNECKTFGFPPRNPACKSRRQFLNCSNRTKYESSLTGRHFVIDGKRSCVLFSISSASTVAAFFLRDRLHG